MENTELVPAMDLATESLAEVANGKLSLDLINLDAFLNGFLTKTIQSKIEQLFRDEFETVIESLVRDAVSAALNPDNIDCRDIVEQSIEDALENVCITFRG